MSVSRILVLQPPSPAHLNVMRDYAGGFGVAFRSSRPDYGHEGGSAPYLSAFYAAAVLEREGWSVDILDCQAEELAASEALSRIAQFSPQIIISVVSLPSLQGDLAFLGNVRASLRDVDVVGIGTVCKVLHHELLRSGHLTAAVRGDAEIVVPRLVSALSNGHDLSSVPGIACVRPGVGVVTTKDAERLASLNDLPAPPYNKLPMKRYREPSWSEDVGYMAILDGRGCPYQCGSYCPYPFGFGRRTLLRDPELVVDEIQYLHEEFATEAFIFRSQTFTMNREHAELICREILRRRLRVRWLCETRLDSVDPETLRLMKAAGCQRVHYGLESGDPQLFEAVGKPGCDLAVYGRMVDKTREIGMEAKLNVVIGLPGESWKTIHRTIQTVRQLRPSAHMAAIITPYPGTELFDDAKRRGLLLTEDWSRYTGFEPVMRTDHLTAKDLLTAKRIVERCLDRTPLPTRATRKALGLLRRATRPEANTG